MLSVKGVRLVDNNDNPGSLYRIYSICLPVVTNKLLAHEEAVSFLHLLCRLINNLGNPLPRSTSTIMQPSLPLVNQTDMVNWNINKDQIRDLTNVSALEDCEIITPMENLHSELLYNKYKIM